MGLHLSSLDRLGVDDHKILSAFQTNIVLLGEQFPHIYILVGVFEPCWLHQPTRSHCSFAEDRSSGVGGEGCHIMLLPDMIKPYDRSSW